MVRYGILVRVEHWHSGPLALQRYKTCSVLYDAIGDQGAVSCVVSCLDSSQLLLWGVQLMSMKGMRKTSMVMVNSASAECASRYLERKTEHLG